MAVNHWPGYSAHWFVPSSKRLSQDDPYYFLQEGKYVPKSERVSESSTDDEQFIASLVPSYLKWVILLLSRAFADSPNRVDYQGRVIRLDTFSKACVLYHIQTVILTCISRLFARVHVWDGSPVTQCLQNAWREQPRPRRKLPVVSLRWGLNNLSTVCYATSRLDLRHLLAQELALRRLYKMA